MTDEPRIRVGDAESGRSTKAKKRKSKASAKYRSASRSRAEKFDGQAGRPADPIGDSADGEAASSTGHVAETS